MQVKLISQLKGISKNYRLLMPISRRHPPMGNQIVVESAALHAGLYVELEHFVEVAYRLVVGVGVGGDVYFIELMIKPME